MADHFTVWLTCYVTKKPHDFKISNLVKTSKLIKNFQLFFSIDVHSDCIDHLTDCLADWLTDWPNDKIMNSPIAYLIDLLTV